MNAFHHQAVARDAEVTAGAAPVTEWSRWRASTPYTLGVEEELMLLDPASWDLAQRSDEVLPRLGEALAGHLAAETHQGALEITTAPHTTVAGAAAELRALRRRLREGLDEVGLAAAVAGMHPTTTAEETRVSPAGRYQVIHRTMRELARREPTFALHVHIGVGDAAGAMRLFNRLRAHLPVFLAMSAGSPYWRGRDTGLASNRTILFQAFPRTGMPRRFAGYDDWVATVGTLVRTGAIPEPTFLWWDLRPQPRFGTIEVRIMDAQPRVQATAALCALIQSVARLELEEGYAAPDLVRADEVLAENRFLAARDGSRAELVDPVAGRRVPVRELVDALMAAAQPHAEALGCADELALIPALAASDSAMHQRTIADERGLPGLVAALSAAFDDGA